MMFNVRNNTNITQDDIRVFIEKYLSGLDFELEMTQGSYPFKTEVQTKIVEKIDQAIESITSIEPKHSTAGGTSDARFISAFGIAVVEFGVKNDTIHSVNERTSIKEVEDLYKVFKTLIEIWNK